MHVTDWLLPAEDLHHARHGGRLWRVVREQGKRSTTCRECGEKIAAGEMRHHFRKVDPVTRTYCVQGYVHADPKICEAALTEQAVTEFQQQLLDELTESELAELVAVPIEQLQD